jgi:thioester reductase-like protein
LNPRDLLLLDSRGDDMTVLMTGFPGFLASALLPGILRRTGGGATCLVQPKYADLAARRAEELAAADASLAGRVQLVEGDITKPGLGLNGRGGLDEVTEVWHLAAVYDLAVERELAVRVNVEGTRNVLDTITGCPGLERLHYFSTCYVSGRYAGPFGEDDLEVGAPFNNYYEETKHDAEAEVHRRMAAGLPATIYRPSIVVGDSRTGETQKFDGPYFVMQWLLRQPKLVALPKFALLPLAGDPAVTRINVVPRDFIIDAVSYLSGQPQSQGRTYQLADPDPLTIAEMVDTLALATGRKVIKVGLPREVAKGALAHVPGAYKLLRIPPEAVDYYAHPTHYLSDHTQADLASSGIHVPPFASYVDRLVEFMQQHPEIGSAAMA